MGVAFLDLMKRNKIKTYVHCKNGHGRAPTLFAAYLVSQGMGVDGAVASIKAKRPTVHLVASQVRALQKFEARLPKRGDASQK
jgi:protein-tyrosine phosphatase